MATSFVPIEDDASFSIQGSNYSMVANFSSDLNSVYLKSYASNNSSVGFLWGVSNITSTGARFVVGRTSVSDSNVPNTDLTIYNGNVGIGITTTASYKLDVAGDINYTGTLYNNGSAVRVYGSNNNIGIGTSSPQYPLDVRGRLYVENTSSTGPALTVLQKTQGGNGNIAEFYDTDYPANTPPVMTIADNKTVGINTTAISEALDVNGKIRTNSQFVSTQPNGTPPLVVTSSNLVANLNVNYLGGKDISFFQTASNIIFDKLPVTVFPLSGATTGTYGDASNLVRIGVDQYGRVTSANAVSVQIPTANVIGLCNVAKTGDYNDLINKTFVLSGTNALFTTGNVGIGNTPDNGIRLQVESLSGDALLRLKAANSANNVGVEMTRNTNPLTGMRMIYATSDDKLYLQKVNGTTYTSFVAIDNATGNVGVGTTSPISLLHVNGTFRATNINADDITTGVLSSNILQVVPGIVATSYGTASCNVAISVDTKGRVTSIAAQPISIQKSAITDIVDPWARATVTTNLIYTTGNVGIGTTIVTEKLRVEGTATFAGHITPTACNIYDLGSANFRFRDLYLSGSSIDLGGARFTTLSNILFLSAPAGSGSTYMNTFVNNITAAGNISAANLVSSAFVDTTQASNIGFGTLPIARLPVSAVTPTTYGTSSNVPIITVDTYGRVTAASTSTTIDYNNLLNKTFVLNGSTAFYTAGSVGIGTNNTAGTALAIGTGTNDTTSVLMLNSGDTATNTNKIIFTFQQDGSRIGHSAGWNVNLFAGQSNTTSGGNFRYFLPSGLTNGGYYERVSFTASGNVGIGSTVPAFTLDVATGNGDVNFNGTLYQNKTNIIVYNTGVINSNALPTINGLVATTYGSSSAVPRVTVDTKGRVTAITTQNLATVAATGDYNSLSNTTFVLTNTSNATYTIANGNVGVGTLIPKAKLHIDSAAGNEIVRFSNTLDNGINITTSTANASGATDYVRFGCKPAIVGGVSGGNYEPFLTLVNTFSRTYADLTLVENGGNVGIGTTSISNAKLQVQGDVNVTGAIKQNGTTVVSNTGVLSASSLPVVAGLTNGASFGNASNVATFTVDDKGRLATVTNVPINNVPAANITSLCNVAKTANYTDLSNVPFVKNGTDAYYNYNGNVGIGYANPTYKLAVNGNVYCNGTLYTSNISAIGTVTTINTTTSNTQQMFVTNAGTGPAVYVQQTGANVIAEFWDDATIAMKIDDGGFVGIGTSTPLYKLDVNGTANIVGTLYQNGTSVISGGVLNANTFPVSGASAGTYGSITSSTATVPQITVNNKGIVTSITTTSLNLAASATVDTTQASNVTGGKLPVTVLPNVAGVAGGPYGAINSSTATVPQITVDSYGRVSAIATSSLNLAPSATIDTTQASNVNVGKLPVTVLPNVAGVAGGPYGAINSSTATVPQITIDSYGRVSAISTASLNLAPSATIDTTQASNVTGGKLPVTVFPIITPSVAGTFGSKSNIPVITVDQYGRVSAISTSGTIDYNDLTNKLFTASGNDAYFAQSGNVGIGTATALSKMHVNGTVRATQFIGDGSQLTGIMTAGGTVSSQWQDSNVGTSSNIYYNQGLVGIGTTSPKYKLHVVGDVYANNVITYSDAKYKIDVATINDALTKVNNIRGVSYKLASSIDDRTYLGVIAQEVEKQIPQVVYTDDAGLKSVSYGNLAGVFIEAIKDLTRIIGEQSARISALEKQVGGGPAMPEPQPM